VIFALSMQGTKAVNAIGCNVDAKLCNTEGGTCLYNGLCVCKTNYLGDTCELSNLINKK